MTIPKKHREIKDYSSGLFDLTDAKFRMKLKTRLEAEEVIVAYEVELDRNKTVDLRTMLCKNDAVQYVSNLYRIYGKTHTESLNETRSIEKGMVSHFF